MEQPCSAKQELALTLSNFHESFEPSTQSTYGLSDRHAGRPSHGGYSGIATAAYLTGLPSMPRFFAGTASYCWNGRWRRRFLPFSG
jgi:hypothetical protein